MKNSIKLQLVSSAILIIMYSCTSFEPGWNHLATKTSTQDVNILKAKAQKLELNSSTAKEIESLIEAYSETKKVDPSNYFGL
jgi:hypothetical protein